MFSRCALSMFSYIVRERLEPVLSNTFETSSHGPDTWLHNEHDVASRIYLQGRFTAGVQKYSAGPEWTHYCAWSQPRSELACLLFLYMRVPACSGCLFFILCCRKLPCRKAGT
jgi:hypothetical protein